MCNENIYSHNTSIIAGVEFTAGSFSILIAEHFIFFPISFFLNEVVSVLYVSYKDPFNSDLFEVAAITESSMYQVNVAFGLTPLAEQLKVTT